MVGQYNNKERGITLIEALVSTAIVAIGFIAIFQMVSYSVQAIDVSNERTKTSYMTSMVAEDILADKFSDISGKKLYESRFANYSKKEAYQACKRLAKYGRDCFVRL